MSSILDQRSSLAAPYVGSALASIPLLKVQPNLVDISHLVTELCVKMEDEVTKDLQLPLESVEGHIDTDGDESDSTISDTGDTKATEEEVTSVEEAIDEGNLDEESTAEVVSMLVNRAYTKLKHDDRYSHHFEVLSQLANRIGANLVSTFNILSNRVKPEVDRLKTEIDKHTEEYIQSKQMYIPTIPSSDLGHKLHVLDWDKHLRVLGGVERITDTFKDIQDYGGSLSFHDIPTLLGMGKLETEVAISDGETLDEVKTDLEDKIVVEKVLDTNEADDGIDTEDPDKPCTPTGDVEQPDGKDHTLPTITDCIQLINDPYRFKTVVREQLMETNSTNDVARILRRNLKFLKQARLYRAISQVPVNLSYDVLTKWLHNLDMVERLFMMVGYQVLVIRKHYSDKDAILLDSSIVNGDTLRKYKKQGGTTEMLVQHLVSYYTSQDRPVTAYGVSMQDVFTHKSDAMESFEVKRQSNLHDIHRIQQRSRRAAVDEVLRDYIHSTPASSLPKGITSNYYYDAKKHLVDRSIRMLDTSPDSNLESVLYDFVIQLKYDESAVMLAHETFGKEVVKQLELKEQLDAKDMALIDTKVGATLVSNFLVKHVYTPADDV